MFFQAEDGIRDVAVTGVQTCALPISGAKFIAYDLAASRQIVAEQTMAEKIRVWSRFAIADIGFYPELNYFTFVAKNGFEWI